MCWQTFVLSCLLTQYGPALDKNGDGVYDGELALYGDLINYVLSAIFVVELGISLYAHWWRPFFTSGWKIFDLAIVIFSLVTVTRWSPIPAEIARAMRIFRVFGTAESLRRIINPLIASVIPVANAFVILFVIMAFGAPYPLLLASLHVYWTSFVLSLALGALLETFSRTVLSPSRSTRLRTMIFSF